MKLLTLTKQRIILTKISQTMETRQHRIQPNHYIEKFLCLDKMFCYKCNELIELDTYYESGSNGSARRCFRKYYHSDCFNRLYH